MGKLWYILVLLAAVAVTATLVARQFGEKSPAPASSADVEATPAKPPDAVQAKTLDPADKVTAQTVALPTNDFGFRLLAELRKGKTDNVFISPTSLSMALSMTCNGAAGATKDEMAKVLGVDKLTRQALNEGQLALLDYLPDSDPKVQLTIANALWLQEGHTFLDDFLARNEQYYRAKVTVTDITGDAGVKQINAWVEDATDGMITDLLKSGDLNPLTRLVLTNAVYFNGRWTNEFERINTKDAPFTLEDGKTQQVPMMSLRRELAYLDTDEVQGLRLPYGEGRMAMYLLLPKRQMRDDIALYSMVNWERWLPLFKKKDVQAFIPRFYTEFTIDLNKYLIALGMKSAFDMNNADFTGIDGTHNLYNLYISLVRHITRLQVDEQGTVAAAATAVDVEATGIPPDPVVFRADRPFFCTIRDDDTGALLFLGVINNPE